MPRGGEESQFMTCAERVEAERMHDERERQPAERPKGWARP